ncbi:unnamed protein product [Didymodactylos carnosus]|uniref:Uncharacterized protein n=1 Tax=Didymodactylos carnosus TaxID=1234261 RepID=A0A815BNM3_9BILA|nr:unnamed protein product [Didymodactylos carnosus]CAF4067479.1 unnamed protein product [Didymodactylos carnosus]
MELEKQINSAQITGVAIIMLAFADDVKQIICQRRGQNRQIKPTDIYGDTSLHYVVARHDKYLTVMLLADGKAVINGGDVKRPSALDTTLFTQNSELKELLLSNNGKRRCLIKCKTQKRKMSQDDLKLHMQRLSTAPYKEEK